MKMDHTKETDASPADTRGPAPEQEVGDAIERVLTHAGGMGRYQRLLFACTLPCGLAWAFTYFGQMFIAATPQHWCRVPELAALDVELRRNLSIPWQGGAWSSCLVWDADWAEVLATLRPPEGAAAVPCAHGWEFLYDDIPYETVVSEREWVCDRANLVPWAQSIQYLGSIVGGLLFGKLADKFGRLWILVVSNLAGLVGSVAPIFTSGFWDFCVCRFISGMAVDSCFIMIYILVMEYVGVRHRTWVGNTAIALFFGGGCVLLPFLALWSGGWRVFSLAVAVPMLLPVLAPLVVPESARWLAARGNVDKAVNNYKTLARVNRRSIPQDVMDDFIKSARSLKEPRSSLGLLLRRASTRRVLAFLVLALVTTAVVFDVLIRLSETLGLDFFYTFAVTSATELPSNAVIVLLLDRVGRRPLAFTSILVAGVLCFFAAFVPRGIWSVSLAVLARFFVNMTYNAVIQWSAEALPTPLRAQGAALVHVSAFAGIVLSPFVVYSERVWLPLPLLIAGAVGALGAGAALALPETAGRPLPQTLADGDALASTMWICGPSKTDDTDLEISAPGHKETS